MCNFLHGKGLSKICKRKTGEKRPFVVLSVEVDSRNYQSGFCLLASVFWNDIQTRHSSVFCTLYSVFLLAVPSLELPYTSACIYYFILAGKKRVAV
jgi:hypothetical protein